MSDPRNTAEALATLSGNLDLFIEVYDRERADAKAVREHINTSLADIKSEATGVGHRVSNLEKDMESVKPVIAKVNGWHSMLFGAAIVLSLLGGAVSLFWQAVKEKFVATFGG